MLSVVVLFYFLSTMSFLFQSSLGIDHGVAVAVAVKLLESCPTLCDPIGKCSLEILGDLLDDSAHYW